VSNIDSAVYGQVCGLHPKIEFVTWPIVLSNNIEQCWKRVNHTQYTMLSSKYTPYSWHTSTEHIARWQCVSHAEVYLAQYRWVHTQYIMPINSWSKGYNIHDMFRIVCFYINVWLEGQSMSAVHLRHARMPKFYKWKYTVIELIWTFKLCRCIYHLYFVLVIDHFSEQICEWSKYLS
jgi:hypothetical protein